MAIWEREKNLGTKLDSKTVRIFVYSSTREQSNKRSGMRLKTESETRRACEARALRALKTLSHALPISLLILRKKTDCFAVYDEVGYLSNTCWATVLYDHAQNKRICVLASQRQTQRKELRDRWAWWRKTELSNHHILNFSLRLQINCRIHICTFCAWSWKLFTIEWMISQQKPRLWTDVAIIMAIWSFFLFFAIVSVSLNRRVSISIYGLGRGVLCMAEKLETDHYTFLGNCPPTLPLSQHFALSEK